MLLATEPQSGVCSVDADVSLDLRAVLFTDIVESTAMQVVLGDCAWRDLLLAHHRAVRASVARWQGVENDTAGDGFYVTFDDARSAVRCALDITRRVRTLGIQVRAGVHHGTCEVAEGKCSGLTVSVGARVAALAGASEVLATDAVRANVDDPGLVFLRRRARHLKGVPGTWRLFRVQATDGHRQVAP
jgi:class 3 adenylate cyclase